MSEADALEKELYVKALKLAALRAAEPGVEVPDYEFEKIDGSVSLSELFTDRDRLLLIHNMGQACRYCTLWADGINGIISHLENAFSVVLVSKDAPELQRRMAQSRGWRFRLASHGGGKYLHEQNISDDFQNCPGAVVYEKRDGKIFRRGRAPFGPGDLYSPMWHFLSLAGLGEEDWTPQYRYWSLPTKMEDGGENVCD